MRKRNASSNARASGCALCRAYQAVARASRAPLSMNFSRSGIARADTPVPDPPSLLVETVAVGEKYFDAVGVPILEGRPFDDAIEHARISTRSDRQRGARPAFSGRPEALSVGGFARRVRTATGPRSRLSVSPATTGCASCKSRPRRTSTSRRPRVAPTCCPLRCRSRAPRATRARSARRCSECCARSTRTWSFWKA